ncbi:adenylate cyclase [Devosia limi DSM 17137]|uniref:Adenylate cyclase n=1 Tax=Devosia limi DSM 17137 TaxID=1121477 RepID=A0A0F5LPJ4_9HYPH|nr:CYTH domain-containing protein [Devosia limi]KKB84044.1 adenylate cyclase [Devosia limi DSM 17137]SHE62518.1 adenylate cyclase [Devosia limi DSM 17137]
MAQEIERKFLVSSDGWRASVRSSSQVRQGYLSSNAKATVRVRSYDDQRAVLTLKGRASGLVRAEYEYAIPVEDARELLEMAQPHVLEKRRYLVEHDGMTWEVDVFEGRHQGLVLAEIELERADQAVKLPDWVGEEVSEDERYFNATLSRS